MTRKSLLMVLILIMVLLGLRSPKGFGAEKIRFGSALKESPQYALLFLAAEEEGFWKGQGLKVEWLPFLTGPPLYQAAAARAVDVGLGGTIPAIESMAEGYP